MSTINPLDTWAIRALHAESPLRIWSLIVTIFGDIVMQQGQREAPDPIWNGALLELLSLMGIEPGLVRTSLSRLVSNGTLTRFKSGRNTYYQLAAPSRVAFVSAAEVIYRRKPADGASCLIMVAIDRCPDRGKSRDRLSAQGFRFIGPTVALAVGNPDTHALHLPEQSLLSIPKASDALFVAAHDIWKLDSLDKGYHSFLETFPLLSANHGLAPDEAITQRVLLVHQFRRLILRDPQLPETALPHAWKGGLARQRFTANWDALAQSSDEWIVTKAFLAGTISHPETEYVTK